MESTVIISLAIALTAIVCLSLGLGFQGSAGNGSSSGSSIGPAGPKGAQVLISDTGPRGMMGPAGPTSILSTVTGPTGSTGGRSTGPTGPSGYTGPSGSYTQATGTAILFDQANTNLGRNNSGLYVQIVGPNNVGNWFWANIFVPGGTGAVGPLRVVIPFVRTNTALEWPINLVITDKPSIPTYQVLATMLPGNTYISLFKVDPVTGQSSTLDGPDLSSSGLTVINQLVLSGLLQVG